MVSGSPVTHKSSSHSSFYAKTYLFVVLANSYFSRIKCCEHLPLLSALCFLLHAAYSISYLSISLTNIPHLLVPYHENQQRLDHAVYLTLYNDSLLHLLHKLNFVHLPPTYQIIMLLLIYLNPLAL